MEKNNYYKIGAYLNKKLSAKEASAFEDALRQDPDLKQALEDYQEVGPVVSAYKHNEEAQRYFERGKKLMAQSRKPPVKPGIIMLRMAAAIAILVGGYWTYSNLMVENTSIIVPVATIEKLVKEVKAPKINQLLSNQEDLVLQWYENVSTLKNGDSESFLNNAQRFLDDLTFMQQRQNEVYLMYGYAWFKEQDYELANSYFNRIPTTTSLKDQADWYQALIQLREGEQEAGLEKIRLIAKTKDHFQYRAALDFLEKWPRN